MSLTIDQKTKHPKIHREIDVCEIETKAKDYIFSIEQVEAFVKKAKEGGATLISVNCDTNNWNEQDGASMNAFYKMLETDEQHEMRVLRKISQQEKEYARKMKAAKACVFALRKQYPEIIEELNS